MGTDAERAATFEGLASVAGHLRVACWTRAAPAPRAGDHLPAATRASRARRASRPARADQRRPARRATRGRRGDGRRRRADRRRGLLLVDKPAGVTSHDVVAIVRRALRHAPGRPCRNARSVCDRTPRRAPRPRDAAHSVRATASRRSTRRRFAFGAETDTDDVTGDRHARRPTAARRGDRRRHRSAHRRRSSRFRPRYSAKQVDGIRAYDAARRGAPLELEPVARHGP